MQSYYYGEPQYRIPEKQGGEYLVYQNDFGVIRLGSERSADGDIAYPLYFTPDDRRPSSFFCEVIVAQIDSFAEKQTVMVFEHGYRQPYMWAVVEYGQIQEVIQINKEAIE